jgi:catechol 2,3-dioxygenase-like lactoylglutathione lyase family enzyme
MKPQLMHIGIKVDDIEKVSAFYEKVFGFQQTGTNRIGDTNTHTSRHLTDGVSSTKESRGCRLRHAKADFSRGCGAILSGGSASGCSRSTSARPRVGVRLRASLRNAGNRYR